MGNTIKITEKKITTTTEKNDEIIIETWEPYPPDNDPKKEFIKYDNQTYYLTSKKTKSK